jgi:hypothetical protein
MSSRPIIPSPIYMDSKLYFDREIKPRGTYMHVLNQKRKKKKKRRTEDRRKDQSMNELGKFCERKFSYSKIELSMFYQSTDQDS